MATIEQEGFLSEEAEQGRSVFRAKYSGVLALAAEMNRVAIAKLQEARLSEIDDADFILYLLAIRIVEAYEAIVILMERGMVASAKLIIRPQLEALFTLAAIDKDRSLVQRYFDAQANAQFEKLKSSTKWQADALKAIFKEDGLEAKYIDMKKNRKAAPPAALRPFEWAQKAEMDDYYNTYYVHYASYTHTNREALEENMEWEEERVTAAFGPSDTGFYETIRHATAFTLLATMHMCAAFKLPFTTELAGIHESIKKCDAQYDTS